MTPSQRLLKALLWLQPAHLNALFASPGIRASAMQVFFLFFVGRRWMMGCSMCIFVCFPHFECQAARGADTGVAQTAKEVLAKLA